MNRFEKRAHGIAMLVKPPHHLRSPFRINLHASPRWDRTSLQKILQNGQRWKLLQLAARGWGSSLVVLFRNMVRASVSFDVHTKLQRPFACSLRAAKSTRWPI